MSNNKIKIGLMQLRDLFGQSAAEQNLPKSVRALAARLTLLVAHTERVDKKASAALELVQQLDKHLAELVSLVVEQKDTTKSAAQQQPQPQAPQPPTDNVAAATAAVSAPAAIAEPEENDIDSMAAKMVAEEEAEVAAAGVTPLRQVPHIEGAA